MAADNKSWFQTIMEKLPFQKLTGAMVLVLVIQLAVLWFVVDLYKFNVTNNVQGGFPENWQMLFLFAIPLVSTPIFGVVLNSNLSKKNEQKGLPKGGPVLLGPVPGRRNTKK